MIVFGGNVFEIWKNMRRTTLATTLVIVLVGYGLIPRVNSPISFASAQSVGRPHQSKPAPAPARWRGLIGEYGPDDEILIVLEKDGRLCALFKRSQEFEVLNEVNRNTFKFSAPGPHAEQRLTFERDRTGRATQAAVDAIVLKRRNIEPESGNQLRVKPVRPVADLMKEALAAQPPLENG